MAALALHPPRRRRCVPTSGGPMAYIPRSAQRRIRLAHAELAHATCGTIRLKLLKIGALVRISAWRIEIAMSSAAPAANAWRLAACRIQVVFEKEAGPISPTWNMGPVVARLPAREHEQKGGPIARCWRCRAHLPHVEPLALPVSASPPKFSARARSTNRRMASGRDGRGSGCRAIHASSAASWGG